ncbi:hypothetical protein DET50_11680 [Marinobacter pelagius]|uniref:Uncharacterized protein n=1 Tax=Marinobacter pelagius TaxID=379482 RepID=A0A366GJK7_9GAMM|nr:hypothetical protein DET50_11680 [Marinobacter pelagius]
MPETIQCLFVGYPVSYFYLDIRKAHTDFIMGAFPDCCSNQAAWPLVSIEKGHTFAW